MVMDQSIEIVSTDIRRILVCDDDSSFRKRLSKALRDKGFLVFEASCVAEGYDVVQEFGVDACLIDLRMPGGDGLQLVEKLYRDFPKIRSVVFTGFGTIQTALDAIRKGAVNYLTKPAGIDEIIAAIFPEQIKTQSTVAMPSLEEVEMEYIQRVLSECEGNITKAAKVLGMHRRSLQRKLAGFGSR